MVLSHCPGASMQVGNAFNKSKAEDELKLIASDPDETHVFKVTNYAALDGLLSQLQQSIVPMEGEGPRGPGLPVAAPLAFSRKPEPCTLPSSLSYIYLCGILGNSGRLSEPQLFCL